MNNYNPNQRTNKKSVNLCVKKREKPNRLRNSPTFCFRATQLSPSAIQYLINLKRFKKQGRFINDAINAYYFYITNPKFYFRQLIELNFGLIRHILRKVGRKKCLK